MSKIFYSLHAATNQTINASVPLIIWLQGGPGCSSQFGNMYEIGPMNLKFDNSSKHSQYSPKASTWSDTNHLLFIDQPLGVGFSIQDPNDPNVTNTNQAAQDVQTFLIRFFQIYPNLLDNDIYLFGESYAGHYVPATGAVIYNNQTLSGIHLTGIGVGDGIIDPINQVGFWDYYTYTNGLISAGGRDNMSQAENDCIKNILNNNMAQAAEQMDDILDHIGEVNPGINIYNFRQYNVNPGADLDDWGNSSDLKTLWNIPQNLVYQGCNGDVYNNFIADITVSFADAIKQLAGNVKILIYNGQDDIIINTPGQENWLWNLQWPRSQDITQADKQLWTLNGDVIGTVQTKGKTWFAVVNKAGHMVPGDQPVSCRDMLTHYQNSDSSWSG
jgi:carboxypeptidase C (cathepsin A)